MELIHEFQLTMVNHDAPEGNYCLLKIRTHLDISPVPEAASIMTICSQIPVDGKICSCVANYSTSRLQHVT